MVISDPMAYKRYWNQFSGSQDNRKEIATYDNMMAEYIAIKGIPIEYYPINVDSYKEDMDQIYGENSRPKWDKKIPMLAILEDFSQESQQWSGISLQNVDELVLFVHKTTYDSLVGIRSNKTTNKAQTNIAAFGPIARDEIKMMHNGMGYEVVNGGLHFLPGEAQHFGVKFWYKLTCKSREVSDAVLGEGEQYGAIPDPLLDPKWKSNPQFLAPSPVAADWKGNTGTPIPVVNTDQNLDANGCVIPNEYTTTGTTTDSPTGVPEDLTDPSTGNVKEQYIGNGTKQDSLFSDAEDVKKEAEQIIDPTTDTKAEPNSDAEIKYGPTGRIITRTDRKELFGDW